MAMNIIEYLANVTARISEASLRHDKTEVCRLLRVVSVTLAQTADQIEEVPAVNCNYPNCHAKAQWIPVVKLPTLRTAGDNTAMVPTTRPTLLLFVPVCQEHRDTYALTDWISPGDWTAMQDVAHEKGLHIPDPTVIGVEFKPLDWTPGKDHLEIERGN